MQIQYSLSFRDFANAQKLHEKRSELSYLAYCANHFFYPLLGICVLAFEFSRHYASDSPQPKLFGLLCGLILVCIPVYLRLMQRRCYNRTRIEAGDCTIDFTEEMIRTKSLHSKSEVEWSAIKSYSEDKNGFLLYLAPARFVAIPKRACTEELIGELRVLFIQKIQPPIQ